MADDFAERTSFVEIYSDRNGQNARWRSLFERFQNLFPDREARFFSSPGRVELCGNHTDHNGGRVFAAAVDLDSIAVAALNRENQITIHADGFDTPFNVDLDDLSPRRDETGTTAALIRGIAARFRELGNSIGGFDACITSDVLIGSGLSSSASVEVLIGTIFNALYNASKIDPITIAKVGQYAENKHFGKPCGLMDQIACAVGGVMTIDFRDAEFPNVTNLEPAFGDVEHALVIVNTGGSHADLTDDYAAIPAEMKAVAEALGKREMADVSSDELLANLTHLRRATGDRAVLRALHFFHENARVARQVEALDANDFSGFLQLVNESGDSSWQLLQNCNSTKNPREQSVALALSLTKEFIGKLNSGACRVQGGGFAGTIQAWIPRARLDLYRKLIEPVFGDGCIVTPKIRNRGALEI